MGQGRRTEDRQGGVQTAPQPRQGAGCPGVWPQRHRRCESQSPPTSTHSSASFPGGAATWRPPDPRLEEVETCSESHGLRASSQNLKPLVQGLRTERRERPAEGQRTRPHCPSQQGGGSEPSCPGPRGPAQEAVSAALGADMAEGPDHNGRGALRPPQCSSLLAKRRGPHSPVPPAPSAASPPPGAPSQLLALRRKGD